MNTTKENPLFHVDSHRNWSNCGNFHSICSFLFLSIYLRSRIVNDRLTDFCNIILRELVLPSHLIVVHQKWSKKCWLRDLLERLHIFRTNTLRRYREHERHNLTDDHRSWRNSIRQRICHPFWHSFNIVVTRVLVNNQDEVFVPFVCSRLHFYLQRRMKAFKPASFCSLQGNLQRYFHFVYSMQS